MHRRLPALVTQLARLRGTTEEAVMADLRATVHAAAREALGTDDVEVHVDAVTGRARVLHGGREVTAHLGNIHHGADLYPTDGGHSDGAA